MRGSIHVGLTQFTRQFGGAWREESHTRNVEALAEDRDFQRDMVEAVKGLYERHCTVCRADYVPAETWQKFSLYENLLKPVGIADLMYSLYPAGDDFFSVLVVYRPTLRTPFGPRERDLMHFALQLVDYLLIDGAKVEGAETVIDLSPRERSVLIRLLAGDSVKQIATSLDVSHHTVNDHLKSLHKRFKVNSRAELLAKFIAREHRLKST